MGLKGLGLESIIPAMLKAQVPHVAGVLRPSTRSMQIEQNRRVCCYLDHGAAPMCVFHIVHEFLLVLVLKGEPGTKGAPWRKGPLHGRA